MKQFYKSIIVVLIFSLLSLTACSSLVSRMEPPSVTLAGIEPLDMSLFEQTYKLKLRVQNPNDFDLPLEAMNYVIELNNSRFGQGVSRQNMIIPAYDSAVVETVVISNLASLFENLQDFAVNGNRKMQYRLIGNVKVGNWNDRIPFEYEGEINLDLTGESQLEPL